MQSSIDFMISHFQFYASVATFERGSDICTSVTINFCVCQYVYMCISSKFRTTCTCIY